MEEKFRIESQYVYNAMLEAGLDKCGTIAMYDHGSIKIIVKMDDGDSATLEVTRRVAWSDNLEIYMWASGSFEQLTLIDDTQINQSIAQMLIACQKIKSRRGWHLTSDAKTARIP